MTITKKHTGIFISASVQIILYVKSLIVFLNKIDLVEDPEMHELVEMEVRELLSHYEYDGENIPFVKGSALHALNGTEPALGA